MRSVSQRSPRSVARHGARLVAGLIGLLLPVAGCTGSRTAQETILAFQEAVQAEELERLYCLSAGASGSSELGRDDQERRAGFEAWARARYDSYTEQRERGFVAVEDDAIRLVKLLSLGRGTFFEFGIPRRMAADAVRIPVQLRFGYDQLDLSRLSPGTTFYVNGTPPGTVHSVRVPSGAREVRREVLDGLTVEWTLVRPQAQGGCPGGWAVASAIPVEGSEVVTEITWVF